MADSNYDSALKQGAKTEAFNKNVMTSNVKRATTFNEATLNDLNPAVTVNNNTVSVYNSNTGTMATNPELSKLFDDTGSLLLDHNVADRYEQNWCENFSRFGFMDPFNTTKKTKEYLFFTKPDLNLFTLSGDINPQLSAASSFFVDAIDRYRSVAQQLQYSYSSNKGPLCAILSNAVNSTLELPGISSDYVETARNVYQTSITYRGSSFKSDQDFEFSLEFKDSKFLDVYMFFKMYDEYERLKWMGQVSPPNIEYIKKKILHDQFSVYKIITAEDGMTILYFARAVGVYPMSVPRDSIVNLDGELSFSISFKAQFVYDMDPRILVDLNRITYSYRQGMRDLPLFNTDRKLPEGTWASCPYIVHIANADNDKLKRHKYYLLWAKGD